LDVIKAEQGGYELIHIPGGQFMMGSPESEEGRDDDEGPLHDVRVKNFYLGRNPVTNEEYGRFLSERSGCFFCHARTKHVPVEAGKGHPVGSVSNFLDSCLRRNDGLYCNKLPNRSNQ